MHPLLPPILIVDDHPDELFLTERLIRKTGTRHPIRTANGGDEAIDLLRKSCLAGGGRRGDKPVLVFLDVNMPMVNGFEVLRWIRKKKALRRVKVIMLSSSGEAKDIETAQRLGAAGYLIKFPSATIMAAMLHEVAEGRPALPAPARPCSAVEAPAEAKPRT